MNIKELIEAGAYPTDDKGRALVPTRGGIAATILATDVGDHWSVVGFILGHVYRWNDDGVARSGESGYADTLLPPPPRKVVRWAALSHEQLDALGMYESDGPAQREVCGGKLLTRIEYEIAKLPEGA